VNKTESITTTLLEPEITTGAKKIRLAINGFGRIGRAALKVALTKANIEIVAINDLSDIATLVHLLKYDSVMGRFAGEIVEEESSFIIDGHKIRVLAIKELENLPWKDLKIDVVLECTGRYTQDGASEGHIKAGAKKVIISAPAKGGAVKTIILGVNDSTYKNEPLVSNGSCTTNCVSPVIRVIKESLGIKNLTATTIHAVTAEQNIVDSAPPALHKDLRRARAAFSNIIPTTSGAGSAVVEVFPDLEGKIDIGAIRVPVICGSLTDFTITVEKDIVVADVNQLFKLAVSDPEYRGVLSATSDQIVSSDILGNPTSALIDLPLTKVISGNIVKVCAWYDNEWGYANRLAELAQFLFLA